MLCSWCSRHRTRGDGGLVRAETAARCVVVAYWDAVLRAGRGLKRVEHRCGPSPGTCAHARGPRRRFQVPEAKREGRTSVLRTHVHRLRETRQRAFQSEKPYPPSSDAAVLSSSRTPMVTSLLRARYVMSGTLMLIAASSQPPRTHHRVAHSTDARGGGWWMLQVLPPPLPPQAQGV